MMRYARSGHQDRSQELDSKRLERAATPTTKRRLGAVVAALSLPAVLAIAITAVQQQRPAPVVIAKVPPKPVALPVVVPPPPAPPPDLTERDELRSGEALSSALARHGVGADDVSNLVRDLKGTLEVRSLRVGARFTVLKDGARLTRFTFRTTNGQGVPRLITAARLADVDAIPAEAAVEGIGQRVKEAGGPRFDVLVEDAAVVTVVEGVAGTVRGSLYNGVLDAGGDANLVNKFVDVFAWNIDFYRQTQAGDAFKVLVEKKYADDGGERRFLGWGNVVAAEYENAGTTFRGFAFHTADGKFGGTFDETGESLERTFLRNPMEVTRITSNYGMRFHPVLKTERKHEGIDYGAPVGTPIWTVADGVVTEARYSKSAGNMVTISHINGYKTEYFHMSKFAEGMKPGARVKQKQIIGYVGSTGRSTGPHLHFGMLRNNAHLDPAKQKFPNAKPIPATYREEFDVYVAPLLAQLQALLRA